MPYGSNWRYSFLLILLVNSLAGKILKDCSPNTSVEGNESSNFAGPGRRLLVTTLRRGDLASVSTCQNSWRWEESLPTVVCLITPTPNRDIWLFQKDSFLVNTFYPTDASIWKMLRTPVFIIHSESAHFQSSSLSLHIICQLPKVLTSIAYPSTIASRGNLSKLTFLMLPHPVLKQ